MKTMKCVSAIGFSLLTMLLLSQSTKAIVGDSAASKVLTLTVTAEGHDGQAIPQLNQQDIRVQQNNEPVQVAEWAKAKGPLNLYILMDEAISTEVGSQLGDLRDFVRALPLNTRVAIGYASNGTSRIVQDFTEDRNLAVTALRIPMGTLGAYASPYLSVSDLVQRFPDVPERKAILFVSSGFDPLGGNQISNPYVSTAIERAQKSNVQVFTIYANSVFRRGRRFFQIFYAQNNLSRLGDETGADAYFLGTGTPVAFKPFLEDCLAALKNQYILKVSVPRKQEDYWVNLEITTTVAGIEFDHAASSWVPAQD